MGGILCYRLWEEVSGDGCIPCPSEQQEGFEEPLIGQSPLQHRGRLQLRQPSSLACPVHPTGHLADPRGRD